MKLSIRNLGRLREATIDLNKNLILLTGPNNTSKTYVAHAIYGFHQNLAFNLINFLSQRLLKDFRNNRPDTDTRVAIPIIDLTQELAQLLESVAARYRKQLASVFAASEEFVAQTEIKITINQDHLTEQKQKLHDMEDESPAEGSYLVHKRKGEDIWTFERPSALSTSPSSHVSEHGEPTEFWLMICVHVATLLMNLLGDMRPRPFILSAERAAIQLFSRELSTKRTELVDQLLSNVEAESGTAVIEMLERRAQRYPLAIRDSLQYANDLAVLKKETSKFARFAEQLEREVLGGAFRIEDDGDILFKPGSSQAGLTLHLASSSVKSLAGLAVFLRHVAKDGQLLIVDEPELNLHPDNQRRVARMLVRLARAGLKVLITTHSDYVIREINNLIMLSADRNGELRSRHGYDEEETIEPSQVGAYLFDREQGQPIEVSAMGIEVKTIDREINALNSVSQDIYFSLFGKSNA